ncbi:hypothetical protein GCM10007383_34960 [Arenibacter certesii]|uniref:Uncharacterized protein n=2 Tax=Arenibacter certesii TaxID=228955 RepID=A0A918J4L6_9FLAO|nr:hypothetical protein GCM10007383_34960 [Arenibacter certesii]
MRSVEEQNEIKEVIKAYSEIITGHRDNNKELYYKAYTDKDYGSEFIKRMDNEVKISFVNTESYDIGVRKIDSINAIDELSVLSKKIKTDSIVRKYIEPKVSDFLDHEDLQSMAEWSNQKLNFKKLDIKDVLFSLQFNRQISVPVFNKDRTIAFFLERAYNELEANFFRYSEEKGWEFYCSGTLWMVTY